MTTDRVYVGVDVSKDQLDVCVRRGEAQRHDEDNSFVVPHHDAGIDTLVSGLLEEHPELVILEATGGFERAVVAALAAEGLPVAVFTTLARCVSSPGLRVGWPKQIGSMRIDPGALR
jgi:transposase